MFRKTSQPAYDLPHCKVSNHCKDRRLYSNNSCVLLSCLTAILSPSSRVAEVSILLGYVAMLLGNLFSTARYKALVPYSKVEISLKDLCWE